MKLEMDICCEFLSVSLYSIGEGSYEQNCVFKVLCWNLIPQCDYIWNKKAKQHEVKS